MIFEIYLITGRPLFPQLHKTPPLPAFNRRWPDPATLQSNKPHIQKPNTTNMSLTKLGGDT